MIEGKNDKLLVDVNLSVIQFLTNPQNKDDLPKMDLVNEAICKLNLGVLTGEINNGLTHKKAEFELWEERYSAFKLLGEFKTVDKMAIIGLEYYVATSYGSYLGVRDELMNGINQLRNQLSFEKFGVTFKELTSKREAVKTAQDIAWIKAIRTVYPQKILKKKISN
ncbi:hypothetical protein N9544_01260 [Flavobacteriales bacterium]|nr:hypothetical protein [Flavobacteriales bacterium]